MYRRGGSAFFFVGRLIYLLATKIIIMFDWRYAPIRRVEKRKGGSRKKPPEGGALVGFFFILLSLFPLSIYLSLLAPNGFFPSNLFFRWGILS